MFSKTKDVIAADFFRSAIENDYCDLINIALSAQMFKDDPRKNNDWLNLAAKECSRDAIFLLTKQEFDASHADIIFNISLGLAYAPIHMEAYAELIRYIGKDEFTKGVVATFEKERKEVRNNNAINAISTLFKTSNAEGDLEALLNIVFDNMDVSALSKDDAVQIFKHKYVHENPYSLTLLTTLLEKGLLKELNETQKNALIKPLCTSLDTRLVNFCIQENIFTTNELSDVLTDQEESLSFYLLAQLHHEGINIFDVGKKAISSVYTDISLNYFMRHFSNEFMSGNATLDNQAITLFINLFIDEYLEIHNSDSRINGSSFMSGMIAHLDINVLTLITERILAKTSPAGRYKFFANLLRDRGMRGNSATDAKYEYVTFIANNEHYHAYLAQVNKESMKRDAWPYLGSNQYYFLKVNQHKDFELTKLLLSKVNTSQRMIIDIIDFVKKDDSTLSKNAAFTLLEIILPYMSDITRDKLFNESSWKYSTDDYSISRDLASLERAKTQSTIMEKVIAVSTAPTQKVIEFINNSNRGKNTHERVQALLRVHNIDPIDAMLSKTMSEKGKSVIAEVLSGS